MDENGNVLINEKRLTFNGNRSWDPVIETDSTNNAHITWSDDRDYGIGGDFEIYYKKSLNLDIPSGPLFIRGDANIDGNVTIADAIKMLNSTFSNGEVLCEDASDVNDDGVLDISDPIFTLGYLFANGPPPPPPFPNPGTDPTSDSLDCDNPIISPLTGSSPIQTAPPTLQEINDAFDAAINSKKVSRSKQRLLTEYKQIALDSLS